MKHIGCGNNGDFAATCPSTREVIPMTDDRISIVLNIHNSLRSKIALGQLAGGLNGASFPPAARMATMSWSQELADLALLNVKRCVKSFDYCHNTAQFKLSGQNLGQTILFTDKSPDVALSGILNGWFNEYKLANATNIERIGPGFLA